ncbi:nitrate ABC transporter substrate-binding protein [Tistrella bauzanensis]|uniref:Nitrate ABC transporter substrate-binding protein n=1 Tax=Tistrella bauzanensis TaxID=657419 RepID=A0ABQ1I7Q3_9PROT|nr:CmpA/NrtA family ABC transporter substrate-binding protein [Tistrella bauzanensis]GGB25123.1 nitrate ABC transporter substrate-binding protein [Tistrella bauzanensis]
MTDTTTSSRPGIRISRRALLGTALTLAAARALLPSGAFAAAGTGPEKRDLTIGFIPLTDCAPLVIAHEKGFFKREGLNVTLSKEASWANIRDKMTIGALDAAHMLAGMPIAATLGLGAIAQPQITALSLDLNGNAITLSNTLFDRMAAADPAAMAERPMTARALKTVIEADKAAGRPPLTFAAVFPVSSHMYELRYWLASAGIDPDQDLRIIVIPPPQMVANLRAGNCDGYCVGEPWNERAVEAGIGKVAITSVELWANQPEKVLGVAADWAAANPATHKAMLRAVISAGQWLDDPANRPEGADIIAGRAYVNAPAEVVRMSMTGTFRYAADEAPRPLPDFNVFSRHAANFPWLSHAEWTLTQMIRWGQIDRPVDIAATAAAVYKPALYREVAAEMGLAAPTIDRKPEGVHDQPWTLTEATSPIAMGPDMFFDGGRFDPADPVGYVRQFAVKAPTVDLAALEAAQSGARAAAA